MTLSIHARARGIGRIEKLRFPIAGFAYTGPTSRDAAVVASFNPGNPTVQISGVSGATGIILVEIYELP